MNKKQIVASLKEIANTLDINGLYKEATNLTKVMVRISQVNPVVGQDIEFLQKHPALLEEFNRLSTQTPKEGVIEIGDIYAKTPYWNMPQRIFEDQIPERIAKLKNFNYHKELAAKRLAYISRKLETEQLSPADRNSLLEDVKYLKRYTSTGSLSNNPALNKPKPVPETAYDAMQNRENEILESMKPKRPDFNQLLTNIVSKNIKSKYPQKSDTEIGLSLSNKTNLQGYKDIAKDQDLILKILSDIEKYSQKYLDAENINRLMSTQFMSKISGSSVR